MSYARGFFDLQLAFARYQAHHYQSYGHVARVTFEPVSETDAMFAPMVEQLRKANR